MESAITYIRDTRMSQKWVRDLYVCQILVRDSFIPPMRIWKALSPTSVTYAQVKYGFMIYMYVRYEFVTHLSPRCVHGKRYHLHPLLMHKSNTGSWFICMSDMSSRSIHSPRAYMESAITYIRDICMCQIWVRGSYVYQIWLVHPRGVYGKRYHLHPWHIHASRMGSWLICMSYMCSSLIHSPEAYMESAITYIRDTIMRQI